MVHCFDVDIAKKYGLTSAILLNHFQYWIEKNKANGKHFYDGNWWTYNTKKAFAELFPYMNERQIDYALNKMVEQGLIIKGNYNKSTYDRTLWYAITKLGYCILQNCEMEETKLQNGNNKIVQPIPDINTHIDNTINKTNNIDDFFESVWQLYPKKTNKSQIKKAAKERLYKVGYDKLARCIERYKEELEFNHTDYQYIKAGSTFFNGGYQDYLADDWTLPTRQPHSTTNAKNTAPTDFANLSAVDKGARILQRLKEEMGE